MFDGDARLALFTISAMGRQRFFEHLRGLGWMLLFALIPWRILRIIVLVVWELARDVTRTIWAWGRGGFRKRLRLDKPVLQVMTNIIFGEVQTFGVVLDVYRGMPAIYANYYGYDEVAHTDGTLGNEALRALHRIDGYIRQIEAARRKHWPETELYICSDHGMTPAVPFRTHRASKSRWVNSSRGMSRASVLWDEATGASVASAPGGTAQGGRWLPAEGIWLLDELDGIEAHLSRRGRRLAQALRRRLVRAATARPDAGLGSGPRERRGRAQLGQPGAHLLQRDGRAHGRQRGRASSIPTWWTRWCAIRASGWCWGWRRAGLSIVAPHGTTRADARTRLPPGSQRSPSRPCADLARRAGRSRTAAIWSCWASGTAQGAS